MCRPLTRAQLDYAQRDAHYLLYIAHKLYEELLAADAVRPAHKGLSKLTKACQRVSLNLYSKHTSQVSCLATVTLCIWQVGSRQGKTIPGQIGSRPGKRTGSCCEAWVAPLRISIAMQQPSARIVLEIAGGDLSRCATVVHSGLQ